MNRTFKAACLAIAATSLAMTPAALAPAHAQTQTQTVVEGLDGDWAGALEVQGMQLRLLMHIATADNATTATLDSIDQGAEGIPVSSITRDGEKFAFEIDMIAGSYEGVIAADNASVSGTWSQGGVDLPLDFAKQ